MKRIFFKTRKSVVLMTACIVALSVFVFLSGCEEVLDKYTVTFNSNGGSDVASQTVASGDKATKPADPTRSGYTFDKWYKEAAFTNEWKFDTDVVTADITLHAKWIDAKQYDIGVVIGGVKWATRNLAAHGEFVAKPEDYGALFQWGRKGDGHEQRTSQIYPTNDTGSGNGVVSGSSNFDSNGQIVSTHSAYGKFIIQWDDPYDWRSPQNASLWNSGTESAPVKTPNDPCPWGWRMPTIAEFQSLLDADSEWMLVNGIDGRRFGSGANTFFLPAAGGRRGYYGTVDYAGEGGMYWSSSTVNGTDSHVLGFESYGAYESFSFRANGYSCRCVSE